MIREARDGHIWKVEVHSTVDRGRFVIIWRWACKAETWTYRERLNIPADIDGDELVGIVLDNLSERSEIW